MLKREKNATITLCISIIILFVICSIVVIINFFTKDKIKEEMLIGISPKIASTKKINVYSEPITLILEEEKKEEEVEIITEQQETEKFEEEKQKVESSAITDEQISKLKTTEQRVVKETTKEINPTEESQNFVSREYKGFTTIAKIEIPKTGVNIPILNKVTIEGMEYAPCLLYSTGELNQNGNNLIVGHNYRNGTLFSNNKNLTLGDKIYITTLDGKRVEYTIYNKFITTSDDVSYLDVETSIEPEITLSCCTDDDLYRIVILAK